MGQTTSRLDGTSDKRSTMKQKEKLRGRESHVPLFLPELKADSAWGEGRREQDTVGVLSQTLPTSQFCPRPILPQTSPLPLVWTSNFLFAKMAACSDEWKIDHQIMQVSVQKGRKWRRNNQNTHNPITRRKLIIFFICSRLFFPCYLEVHKCYIV